MQVADWIIAAHKSGEWLETRGAGKRRVICVDAPGDYPVVIMDAGGSVYRHKADGTYCSMDFPAYDLIPPSREWEVCVWENINDGHVMSCIAPLIEPHKWKLLARATVREGDGRDD